jgi:hypothetical protein
MSDGPVCKFCQKRTTLYAIDYGDGVQTQTCFACMTNFVVKVVERLKKNKTFKEVVKEFKK